MASSTKKKTTSRKKSSGRKNTGSRSRKSSAASGFPWKSEVLLFVVLAFSVVLFITNIGKGGVVGNAVSRFFFGMFGIMSYAFPFVLFLVTAFLISNRNSGRSGGSAYSGRVIMKSLAGVLFFVFLCVFSHLVYMGEDMTGLISLYQECAGARAGGGLVGGVIGYGLVRAFGIWGTYVIDFAILILCIVLITEKSLFKGISKGGKKVYQSAREDSRRRRESAARKREQEREGKVREEQEDISSEEPVIRRRDRKVSGVSLDTGLKPGKDRTASDRLEEVDMSGVEYEGAEAATEQQAREFWENYEEPQIHMPEQEKEEQSEKAAAVQSGESAVQPEVKKKSRKPKQTQAQVDSGVSDISKTIEETSGKQTADYVFPDLRLLKKGDPRKTGDSRQHLQEMSARLQRTLETFGVNARVTNVVCGPSVTQYEIHPEMGVKVSKIVNLADDIKLNLAVPDIRIEAPIPGKAAIGIEVPNKENVTVAFRDLVESKEFQNHPSKISFCVGKDIAGNVIVADIAKMPHLLIAGATGSGKSVCINTIIMSILYKADPSEVKLIMIDPKVVELSVYNNIPHLLIPVVTDPKKAAGALHWAVAEMTERYNKFAEYGVRDIKGYNKKVESVQELPGEDKPRKMTQIVVIVDELADLMMVAPGDVEDAICRLAQLARAAGIHLIIATQRPSVNVITGLIKANMPSRIAFSVTSGVDSRTILDMNGAEKLLGKGDMLFYPQGYSKPLRVQGAFVTDKEVSDVVDYIIDKNGQVSYNSEIEGKVSASESLMGGGSGFTASADDRDTYFDEAARFIIEKEKGSIGMLQRNFRIGFNRAARIMDQLEEAGIVGPEEGTKPRRVLMTMAEYEGESASEES